MSVMTEDRRLIHTIITMKELDPDQKLAAAVIVQALEDAMGKVEKRGLRHGQEARDWFGSEHCLFWFSALLPDGEDHWDTFVKQAAKLIKDSE